MAGAYLIRSYLLSRPVFKPGCRNSNTFRQSVLFSARSLLVDPGAVLDNLTQEIEQFVLFRAASHLHYPIPGLATSVIGECLSSNSYHTFLTPTLHRCLLPIVQHKVCGLIPAEVIVRPPHVRYFYIERNMVAPGSSISPPFASSQSPPSSNDRARMEQGRAVVCNPLPRRHLRHRKRSSPESFQVAIAQAILPGPAHRNQYGVGSRYIRSAYFDNGRPCSFRHSQKKQGVLCRPKSERRPALHALRSAVILWCGVCVKSIQASQGPHSWSGSG